MAWVKHHLINQMFRVALAPGHTCLSSCQSLTAASDWEEECPREQIDQADPCRGLQAVWITIGKYSWASDHEQRMAAEGGQQRTLPGDIQLS